MTSPMQLFEWKDEYRVGVLMVDQRRRHLVSREAQEHMGKHRAMEKRVGDFVAGFSTNSMTTPPKLLAFLKEWLGRHIMETDKEMGRFCAKALEPAALR